MMTVHSNNLLIDYLVDKSIFDLNKPKFFYSQIRRWPNGTATLVSKTENVQVPYRPLSLYIQVETLRVFFTNIEKVRGFHLVKKETLHFLLWMETSYEASNSTRWF